MSPVLFVVVGHSLVLFGKRHFGRIPVLMLSCDGRSFVLNTYLLKVCPNLIMGSPSKMYSLPPCFLVILRKILRSRSRIII